MILEEKSFMSLYTFKEINKHELINFLIKY